MEFREALINRRKELKLSIRKLAEMAIMSGPAISKIELNQHKANKYTRKRLCIALGLDQKTFSVIGEPKTIE